MSTVYVPRSGWTTGARGGAIQHGDTLVGLVAHYTGVHRTYGVLSRARVAAILRGIRRHHRGKGWADIGYTVAIDQAGRVWDLRGITRVPAAHASPSHPLENWHRSAVLFLVGVGEELSADAVEAFRDFRTRVWLGRWPSADDVVGHRSVPGAATACPGDPIAGLIADGTLVGQPHRGSDTPAAPGVDWTGELIMDLHTVRRGDRGEDVATSMALLDRRGFPPRNSRRRGGGWDGIAGPGWEDACRAWQADAKVRNSVRDGRGDGIFGRYSWTHAISGQS